MVDIDTYCIDRRTITEPEKRVFLDEVNGQCPECGRMIITKKKGVKNAQFEIAHIFPNSPKQHQRTILADVERLGENSEDEKNLIALCRSCHTNYDNNISVESYNKMLQKKKDLYTLESSKFALADTDVEQEIILVIDSIDKLDEQTCEGIGSIAYNALRVDEKVEESYFLLRKKIRYLVTNYFSIVDNELKNIVGSKNIVFDIIARQINLVYLKCRAETENKPLIFESLVDWFQCKTNGSKEACEIVVSCFVQNCQVYDKVAQ